MQNNLKRKLADDTLTICLGVNLARIPNIVMIEVQAHPVMQAPAFV